MRTQLFDPGAKRSKRASKILAKVEQFRKGEKRVIFNARENDMQAMKACPICRLASPITQTAQFCCRHCLILFP